MNSLRELGGVQLFYESHINLITQNVFCVRVPSAIDAVDAVGVSLFVIQFSYGSWMAD